jgi:hypothetical protein
VKGDGYSRACSHDVGVLAEQFKPGWWMRATFLYESRSKMTGRSNR